MKARKFHGAVTAIENYELENANKTRGGDEPIQLDYLRSFLNVTSHTGEREEDSHIIFYHQF